MVKWDGDERRKESTRFHGVENLATFIRGEFKNFDTKLESYVKKLNEHHDEIYGKDSDTPGLKIKVHDLVENKKKADKHFWVVYPAIIVLALEAIREFIMGHK